MARSSEWKLEQYGPAGVEMESEVVQERVTPLPPRPRIVRTDPLVQAVMSEGGSQGRGLHGIRRVVSGAWSIQGG